MYKTEYAVLGLELAFNVVVVIGSLFIHIINETKDKKPLTTNTTKCKEARRTRRVDYMVVFVVVVVRVVARL